MGMLLVRNRRLKAESEAVKKQPCEPTKVEVVEKQKETKEVKRTTRKGK